MQPDVNNQAPAVFQGLRSGAGADGVIFYAGGEGSNDWSRSADEFGDADIEAVGTQTLPEPSIATPAG